MKNVFLAVMGIIDIRKDGKKLAENKNKFTVMEIHPENSQILECLYPLIQEWMEEVIIHANTLEFKQVNT